MNQWKSAVMAKTAELIGKGLLPQVATKRARKACRHLHPQAKRATARKLGHIDDRFAVTGKATSFNHI
jgi:hypothetical protein